MACSNKALIATVLALLGPTVPAVTAPQRPAFLMLRDAAQKPIEGALGLVLADPMQQLPALADLGGVELFFTHQPTVIAAGPSRRTGALQLGGGTAGAPRPGAVLVLAEDRAGKNLGLLVPRILPGDADKLTVPAAGLVRGPDATEPITLFAAALVGGRRIVLPALRGTKIPLPPGRYEAWVESSTGFAWQRLEVKSGETITIDFGGKSRRLERPEGATVTPAGRPDVILVDDGRQRCMLCGQAAAAPLTARQPTTGRLVTATDVAFADDTPTFEVTPSFATAPTGPVYGFVMSRSAFGSWRIHGSYQLDDAKKLRLPQISGGDDWLLILAKDNAPFAIPLADLDTSKPLNIATGAPLTVSCKLQGGDPAPDVLLEFVPRHRDVATVAVRTDRYGRADFGHVTLPGTVRTSDERYENITKGIGGLLSSGIKLTLTPGFRVRGNVVLTDGTPQKGVTVTLRAPHDKLRPRQRSTVTTADGTFAFGGLTEKHEYILFATTRRNGRTWSSKVGRITASAEPQTLTIRDEDPKLGPGR